MKSFKEAFEKSIEKGINTAKECIEQQRCVFIYIYIYNIYI